MLFDRENKDFHCLSPELVLEPVLYESAVYASVVLESKHCMLCQKHPVELFVPIIKMLLFLRSLTRTSLRIRIQKVYIYVHYAYIQFLT